MSLMQLLTVTRSVTGTRDAPCPYRMQTPLPKFAPVGRAVSLAPARKSDPALKPALQQQLLFGSPTQRAVLSSESASPAPVLAAELAAPAPRRIRRSSWFRRLFSRSARKADLVQAELELQQVKVVRNDLAEADLELVKAIAPWPAPAERSAAVRSAFWKRWTHRLFAPQRSVAPIIPPINSNSDSTHAAWP